MHVHHTFNIYTSKLQYKPVKVQYCLWLVWWFWDFPWLWGPCYRWYKPDQSSVLSMIGLMVLETPYQSSVLSMIGLMDFETPYQSSVLSMIGLMDFETSLGWETLVTDVTDEGLFPGVRPHVGGQCKVTLAVLMANVALVLPKCSQILAWNEKKMKYWRTF